MPYQHIGEYREKKKESFANWYLLASIVGVAIFFFFLFSFKVIVLVVKFVIAHWVYSTIGVLILLILIKKIRGKRKVEVRYENP